MYINGHFCYAYKFGIITNGLGIVRNITCLDRNFKNTYPELDLTVACDSPEEEKTVADSKALKPILSNFFSLHPQINRHTFLGDASFDTYDTYPFLLNDCKFQRALIPLQKRNGKDNIPNPYFDDFGWPVCPYDANKKFRAKGWSNEKGRAKRFKWVCPETHYEGKNLVCHCENPCTTSRGGRTIQISPNYNLRMYPGEIRNTKK